MTYEESDGEHTPPRAAGSEPTGPTPGTPSAERGITAPAEHASESGSTTPPPPQTHPDPVIAEPSPQPTRLARFGTRWRTSLALRIAAAVVVALLISGIGFTAGTAFGGDENPHHPHGVTADHSFWQDHLHWFHRYTEADTHTDADTTSHHRHMSRTALSETPSPSAAPTR
ncbi:hypothetical protein [Nocardia miyunensis]|uniref:hypothetical protein n=1 Tax=Nocardia miyunensis TaxID=282684 RepID=UPI000A4DC987|nr:hypothetical protein [Nocardia miyunensis]